MVCEVCKRSFFFLDLKKTSKLTRVYLVLVLVLVLVPVELKIKISGSQNIKF